MATEKQAQANRQNAQKSTGPRTPEGKARSCLNHLTTGIDAQSVVIPGENPADRKSLADRYFDQFQPATEDERHQVEILIHCDWQARRFERCEAQTWSRSIEGLFRPDPPTQMAAGYTLYSKTFERLDRRVEKMSASTTTPATSSKSSSPPAAAPKPKPPKPKPPKPKPPNPKPRPPPNPWKPSSKPKPQPPSRMRIRDSNPIPPPRRPRNSVRNRPPTPLALPILCP